MNYLSYILCVCKNSLQNVRYLFHIKNLPPLKNAHEDTIFFADCTIINLIIYFLA